MKGEQIGNISSKMKKKFKNTIFTDEILKNNVEI